jgi:glycosyltransferase involved in cell wall biosynthesis
MKLLIGIPAFNEELMIGSVLRSIPKKISGISSVEVVVVNDGSDDHTEKVARQCGATVITHIINRGLGGALKTIFDYAKTTGSDILVTLDADGQHNPSEIPALVKPILNQNVNVVIGSRWKRLKKAPWTRWAINHLANGFTCILFGISTSDSQSGYRAFDKNSIKQISLKSDGMEVSSEIFSEIVRNKLIFKEVPVEVLYTSYSLRKGQKLGNAVDVVFQLFIRLFQ